MPLPDELVDALLADAGNQLGALPLVAFALAELWPEGGAQPDLTLGAYDRIGRLGGAIGRAQRRWTSTMRSCSSPVSGARPDRRRRHRDPAGRWIDPRSRMPKPGELIDTLVEERFLRHRR